MDAGTREPDSSAPARGDQPDSAGKRDGESQVRCVVCGEPRAAHAERASVRCNVRAFRTERFGVWRCTRCHSIHAEAEVDLARYYRAYPVFAADLDWKLYVVYRGMLRRLTRAGLKKHHRILDYGCGSGLLVRFLRERGYTATVGYDRYAQGHDDPTLLTQQYDCIVSQDVIEHVDDPRALLAQFDQLAAPGAIISIGTPDAEALDLRDTENFVHALHLPYHRHILAAPALLRAGQDRGWQLLRYYDTMYNNTLFPTMNPRFVLHYIRCHDDVFDLVAETPRVNLSLLTPATVFFALFGFFFDRHTDVQAVFRKPVVARSLTEGALT